MGILTFWGFIFLCNMRYTAIIENTPFISEEVLVRLQPLLLLGFLNSRLNPSVLSAGVNACWVLYLKLW